MRYFVFLILFCWTFRVIHAQSESLASNDRLLLEFKRYTSSDTQVILKLTQQISTAYLMAGEIKQSYSEMNIAYEKYRQFIDCKFIHQLITSGFLNDSLDRCLQLIEGLDVYCPEHQIENDVVLAILLAYKGDFESSQKIADSLYAYIGTNPVYIDSLYNNAKSLRIKRPKLARHLSAILPGLGLAYSGKPAMGAANFLWWGASGCYAVLHFLQGYYVTGVFTGTAMFFRFYNGSKVASEVACQRRNDAIIKKSASAICEQMMIDLEVSGQSLHLLKS